MHAISHQIGALYHLPHGLVNAVVLPHVLDFYLDVEGGNIAKLARACRLGKTGDSDAMLARAFVAEVRRLNAHMKIPSYIEQISASDVVSITDRAFAEAHGTYPVPKYMARADCIALVERVAGRLPPALDAS